MPASRSVRSWCETVVWFMPSVVEISPTHMGEMDSADKIFSLVESLSAKKYSASVPSVPPSGINFSMSSRV